MNTSLPHSYRALSLVLLFVSGADEFHPSHIATQQCLGFLEISGPRVIALSVVPFEEGL